MKALNTEQPSTQRSKSRRRLEYIRNSSMRHQPQDRWVMARISKRVRDTKHMLVHGLYMWGRIVGRGKLMDIFYQDLPGGKQRLRFHRLCCRCTMVTNYKAKAIRQIITIASKRRLLCLTDFFVPDVPIRLRRQPCSPVLLPW